MERVWFSTRSSDVRQSSERPSSHSSAKEERSKEVGSVLWGEWTPAQVRFAETRKLAVQLAHCLPGARTPWARLVGFMTQENGGCICEESPLS